MSGYNLFGGNNRNNTSLIGAAIIALILINCLDDDCIGNIAAFLVATGDLMALGLTSNCFKSSHCQREIKGCYY